MKRRWSYTLALGLTVLAALPFWFPRALKATQGRADSTRNGNETTGRRKVNKTDAQWRKLLRRDQYEVTRLKATEPPFSGKYATAHATGTYACVCCNADLFSSTTKFDSGTGWPSFWRPIDPKSIETAADFHMTEPRIEVMCRDCGAHLGHVFDDGPAPTGLRYCLNSVALKLVPPKVEETAKSTSKTAKVKTKAKSKPSKSTVEEPAAEPSVTPSEIPKETKVTTPPVQDEAR